MSLHRSVSMLEDLLSTATLWTTDWILALFVRMPFKVLYELLSKPRLSVLWLLGEGALREHAREVDRKQLKGMLNKPPYVRSSSCILDQRHRPPNGSNLFLLLLQLLVS